jgi:hypothetical protein
MGNSLPTAWIHILDDYSLINIFYLYRPPIFDGDENDDFRTFGGKKWDRERWWHKLTKVCQRWRNLILGSSNYLGLCLVCKWGTPVADMLAHSPPLPLVIDYFDTTARIDEGIIPALEQLHRVRRVRLYMEAPKLQKLIMDIDGEYPVLEYLILVTSAEYESPALKLPEAFEAPHLRHLLLIGFVPPIGSRLLMTAVGMVTLGLYMQNPSAYFQPDILLGCLSFMPQLETLLITILFPISDHVERQLLDTPITTRVTFPNLYWFQFHGSGAYMEAVVHQITAPRLEKLNILLFSHFNRLTLSVPHLLQFMNTTKNLRFDSATFEFSLYRVFVRLYLREEAEVYTLPMTVIYLGPLRMLQVSSVAQIFNSLSQKLSTVENLSLECEASFEVPEVDPAEWRKLLRSFRCVKTLSVDSWLVEEVARCLELDDGEHPLEVLPELQELKYTGGDDIGDVLTPFIDARQNAGRPVALFLPRTSVTPLSRISSPGSSESSGAMTGSSEAGSSEAGSDLDT